MVILGIKYGNHLSNGRYTKGIFFFFFLNRYGVSPPPPPTIPLIVNSIDHPLHSQKNDNRIENNDEDDNDICCFT